MINFDDYKCAQGVFSHFLGISEIPRVSGNTAAIADYLVKFATEHSLEYIRDGKDNVVIKKPASKGYEGRPTVILQGHTDMVGAKRADIDFDFDTEKIKVLRDGDFLRADGTTLGGDDGIAVAYALAILESREAEHPDIEAIFTSDEEIGLLGAGALDCSSLKGRIMINIDSDNEGVFTVGCAGGLRADAILPLSRDVDGGAYYKLTLSGFAGGHSGIEINEGHENAIKVLADMLSAIPSIRISDISGGEADNAIPRYAECVFTTDTDTSSEIFAAIESVIEKYKAAEPSAKFELTAIPAATIPFTKSATKRLLYLIESEPTGVIAMSRDIEGLVETSLNLGMIKIEGNAAHLTFSIRSSVEASKAELTERVGNIARENGASFSTRGEYPAWEYKSDSRLRDTMISVYKELYGKEPKVEAIHAGLECGIFAGKLEGLDCVSIGPDGFDIHTPEERLSIPSVARVWEFLLEVLKRI